MARRRFFAVAVLVLALAAASVTLAASHDGGQPSPGTGVKTGYGPPDSNPGAQPPAGAHGVPVSGPIDTGPAQPANPHPHTGPSKPTQVSDPR